MANSPLTLSAECYSTIVNLMSANDYTGTARTWAQAKAIVEKQGLLPSDADLGASAPAAITTLSGYTVAQKLAAAGPSGSYPWYNIRAWPRLTKLDDHDT